jgi:hypothetical protein
MSDPNPATPDTPTPPEAADGRPGGRPVLGAILLGLGALFAMHKLGLATTDRWWTVLLLVLAGWALVSAVRVYRAAGGWTPPAFGALVGGVLLMALWAKLFFGGIWHGNPGWQAAAWHDAAWHGAHAGHIFFPVILVVVLVAILMRRARWQR